MDGEIRSELDRLHDENKRQNHRLDEHEKKLNDISELTLSVKEIAINCKYTADKVDGIDKRLTTIEQKPLQSIQGAKTTVINTIVAAISGGLVVGLIWLITNHGGM